MTPAGTLGSPFEEAVVKPLRLCAIAVTGTALWAGLAAASPATAAEWNDGAFENTYGFVPGFGGTPVLEALSGHFGGYWGEPDATRPTAGEVAYIRGFVAVTSTRSQAPIMTFLFHPNLAQDTNFAISAQNPVRCYAHATITGPGIPDPQNCNQTPSWSPQGGWFFGGRPLAPGQAFQVQVPVVVSAPRSGIASGDAALFAVRVSTSPGNAVDARQWIFVAPAPQVPAPPVPAPPTPVTGAPSGTLTPAAPPPLPANPAPAGGTTPPGGTATVPATPADTTAPKATALAVLVTRPRQGPPARRLRLRLDEPARVTAVLQRRRAVRGAVRFAAVRTLLVRDLAAGIHTIPLGRLAPGRFRVVLTLVDRSGNRSEVRRPVVVPLTRTR